MKLNGIKYLDANDYSKISIVGTNDDDFRCNITGKKPKYETLPQQNPISKSIDKKDNDKAVRQLLEYYLIYNDITCVKNEYNAYYNIIGIDILSKQGREMVLSIPKILNGKEILKDIINSFDQTMYSEIDNANLKQVWISFNDPTAKKIDYLDATTYRKLNLNNKEQVYDLISYKLNNSTGLVEDSYVFDRPGYFTSAGQYRWCDIKIDNVIYTISDAPVKMQEKIKEMVDEHNKEITEAKDMQLVMKGWK